MYELKSTHFSRDNARGFHQFLLDESCNFYTELSTSIILQT